MSQPEPLPSNDEEAVAAFWQRFLSTSESTLAFTDVATFGDNVALADKLIALVINGPKRATAGSVAEYEAAGTRLPEVGDCWIACDGAGRPRAVLRTTDCRVGPLVSVDESFAWDEGEGDRTRDNWLDMHRRHLDRTLPALDVISNDDTPVVFERFEVVYTE